jgi:hypothetical protein
VGGVYRRFVDKVVHVRWEGHPSASPGFVSLTHSSVLPGEAVVIDRELIFLFQWISRGI